MVGLDHGLLSTQEYQIFLAVTVLTMLITPIEFDVARRLDSSGSPSESSADTTDLDRYGGFPEEHLIIIGYGHVGASGAREMERLDKPYVIVELNPRSVERQRQHGRPIVYGDATNRIVLEEAGIADVRGVLITAGDSSSAVEVAKTVRTLRPNIDLLVRIRYRNQVEALREIGADQIFTDGDAVVTSELDSIDQFF